MARTVMELKLIKADKVFCILIQNGKYQISNNNVIKKGNWQIHDFKKEKEIYVEINKNFYKATLLFLSKEKIELYIHNFNQIFKFHFHESFKLYPSQKEENKLFNKILYSPLNGKVHKIYISENETIQMGAPLLSIEAMKMENIIYAQNDAIIEKIFIKEQDLVKQNQTLIMFSQDKKEKCNGISKNKNSQKTI